MVRRHYRQTLVQCFVVALLLAAVGLLPVVLSPELGLRAFRLRGPWSPPSRWFEYVFPVLFAGMVVAGAGALAWGVALLVRPGWHPLFRRLAEFGPPGEVAAAIDAEVADAGGVTRVGTPVRSFRHARSLHGEVVLTRSWALQVSGFGLRVVRLEDVVWVRKAVFRPAGPQPPLRPDLAHFVEVRVRRGKDEYFGGTEEDVNRLLFELVARLPWVVSGLDCRWEDVWQSDRGKLLIDVDRRREQVRAEGAQGVKELVQEKVPRAQEQARTVEGPGPGR